MFSDDPSVWFNMKSEISEWTDQSVYVEAELISIYFLGIRTGVL